MTGAGTLPSSIQRLLSGLGVVVLVFALVTQILPAQANAIAQVSNRSITMSTSSTTAPASSVTYTVTFTPATSITHPDVVIDFCNISTTPLIGDTCSGTAGTDVPNTSAGAASGWTPTAINTNRGIKLTTGSVSFTALTPVTITLTGMTNPSNTTGFYARLTTYSTGGSSTYSSPTSPGTYTDYGGFALSTVSNISITSKVFETLTFCVFQSSCGTPPALTLGDSTTGALSTSNAYVNSNAQYTLATNASNGVSVTMTGTTLCRTTGSNCQPGGTYATNTIAAVGSSATTPSTGSEQFAMCADKNGSSALTVASTYNDTANNCHGLTTGIASGATLSSLFGFNDTTSAGGTNNAGGSQVLSSSGAVPSVNGSFTFLGDIAITTEAGIYTTSLNMVATGTF